MLNSCRTMKIYHNLTCKCSKRSSSISFSFQPDPLDTIKQSNIYTTPLSPKIYTANTLLHLSSQQHNSHPNSNQHRHSNPRTNPSHTTQRHNPNLKRRFIIPFHRARIRGPVPTIPLKTTRTSTRHRRIRALKTPAQNSARHACRPLSIQRAVR